MRVDLNCDMGESFGRYTLGHDAELMDYVTSVNIACGMHAGDPDTMLRTVRLAKEKGVAVGAHPGLPDLMGFGRREMKVSPREAYALVVYQIGALSGFCRAEGVRLRHVKPHGALYNMAAADKPLAAAIAQAVHDTDPELILVGLAGSELIAAGEQLGLKTASEGFADRAYREDGTLRPRNEPGAVLTRPEDAGRQALWLVEVGHPPNRPVHADGLQASPRRVDTICIHGDHPDAVEFARVIRKTLEEAGVSVAPLYV